MTDMLLLYKSLYVPWKETGPSVKKLRYYTKDNSEFGAGKRRNEFVEWHVAWLTEWHNYVECIINVEWPQRNNLNWKVRLFLAPINLQTQLLF